MMISIVEYARRIGKNPNFIRNVCNAGRFKTADKSSGKWMIDESEEYPIDARMKSGRYVGWRKKYGGNKG